jgi:type IV pilus assembly protein PilN
MAKINLLPWRAERRKQREREFGAIMGAALGLAILVVLGWGWYADQMLAGQKSRNDMLTGEIKALEAKIIEIEALKAKRDKLLQRKEVIETLRASGSGTVRMLDDLVRTIPDGVRLTNIKQNGETLVLEGLAQSQARISSYMRNLETSRWLSKPDLQKSEATGPDKTARYKFSMMVALRKSKEELEAAEEAAGTGMAPTPGGAIPPPPASGG